jgi:exonuclease III
MRIVTYNVNGINGRLANLLGWLEEATPDIVCLQELKAPDEKFPVAAIRAAGYGAIWHGQKGVALSSHPRWTYLSALRSAGSLLGRARHPKTFPCWRWHRSC